MMIKVQLDLTKGVPNEVMTDLVKLVDTVNEHHKKKSPTAKKIEEAREAVTLAEPKNIPDAVADTPTETVDVAPTEVVTTGPTDSKGFNWDARIHAKSKATNKDGSWRYKRGVDKGFIDQIEAELKGQTTMTATTEQIAPPPVQLPTYATKTYTLEGFKNDVFNLLNDLVNAKMIDKQYLEDMTNYLGLTTLVTVVQEGNEDRLQLFYNSLANANLINKA